MIFQAEIDRVFHATVEVEADTVEEADAKLVAGEFQQTGWRFGPREIVSLEAA